MMLLINRREIQTAHVHGPFEKEVAVNTKLIAYLYGHSLILFGSVVKDLKLASPASIGG